MNNENFSKIKAFLVHKKEFEPDSQFILAVKDYFSEALIRKRLSDKDAENLLKGRFVKINSTIYRLEQK